MLQRRHLLESEEVSGKKSARIHECKDEETYPLAAGRARHGYSCTIANEIADNGTKVFSGTEDRNSKACDGGQYMLTCESYDQITSSACRFFELDGFREIGSLPLLSGRETSTQ